MAAVTRNGQWVFPPTSGRVRGRNDDAVTQIERRFDLVELGPFRYDTTPDIDAWINHLAGIEDQIRLLHANPGMLTSGEMPEYLFRRTGGIVGLLERLIEDGCTEAIDGGQELLSITLLESVAISLDNLPARDPDAGEIPQVPDQPRARPRKKRGRNSVFDDGGTPTAAGRK